MPYTTRDFPIEFVNAIVHKEMQGKKPIYNLHRGRSDYDYTIALATYRGKRRPDKRTTGGELKFC